MSLYKKLGVKIKKLREQSGLSQESLASKLGINRGSLSQIEIGGRKTNAEEIAKLAKIFNITTDILLDLEKDIEIVVGEFSGETVKEKTELRISIPQKNLDKFKEVLLYLLNKVGSRPNVGESVIYKLLYFIDFNYYKKFEEQMIGATYIKNTYGPTPKEFAKIVNKMTGKDIVQAKHQYFQYPQRKYIPLRKPDLSKLKADEVKMIDEVLDKLADMNAAQINEYSHGDVPWITTEDNEIIDYESVFYRTPLYSMREYDTEDF
ncbi:type II toxin-antitoxin system antitoxin SocA domain-containing protein [Acidobacteriota bacterium]